MGRVSVGGIEIGYDDRGSGEALVLVHGHPFNRSMWRGRAERPDYVELLAKVGVPALVVVGRDDTYTPVADAEVMHDRLPDSTLVVIEGAAHLPNLERPAEFDEALHRFLRALSI